MARALVVAIAKATNDPTWKRISVGRPERDSIQKDMALVLCAKAGIDVTKPAGIQEVGKSQEALDEFQIIILSKEYFNDVIYAGPQHKEERLYLYHHDDHFDTITSITGFLSTAYYCTHCDKGYHVKYEHTCTCEYKCHDCFSPCCQGWKQTNSRILCSDCHRTFGTHACYLSHIQKSDGLGKSICEQLCACHRCGKKSSQHKYHQKKQSVKFIYLFIYLGFYVAFNTVQVISRWVVGRAEKTSTYSSLGFCTVNCRPTASNYQLSHLRLCQESNPGLRGGRRECYHTATVAPQNKV